MPTDRSLASPGCAGPGYRAWMGSTADAFTTVTLPPSAPKKAVWPASWTATTEPSHSGAGRSTWYSPNTRTGAAAAACGILVTSYLSTYTSRVRRSSSTTWHGAEDASCAGTWTWTCVTSSRWKPVLHKAE